MATSSNWRIATVFSPFYFLVDCQMVYKCERSGNPAKMTSWNHMQHLNNPIKIYSKWRPASAGFKCFMMERQIIILTRAFRIVDWRRSESESFQATELRYYCSGRVQPQWDLLAVREWGRSSQIRWLFWWAYVQDNSIKRFGIFIAQNWSVLLASTRKKPFLQHMFHFRLKRMNLMCHSQLKNRAHFGDATRGASKILGIRHSVIRLELFVRFWHPFLLL